MKTNYLRRQFIKKLGQGAALLPALPLFGSNAQGSIFPEVLSYFDEGLQNHKKLGVALVGLGKYSKEELAPALEKTSLCRLTGIVTGTPAKARDWQQEYKIQANCVYNYDNFDSIADNKDIDIVYIVLPNALHAEYAIRAAKAGKHVICEKPMAVTPEECEQMIQASKKAGKMLSIGYRLHFDPFNMSVAEFGKKKTFGSLKKITALDSQEMDPGVWRLDKKLAGGGPLLDLGIYCVQACLYSAGELPVSVTAKEEPKTDPQKFRSVEQAISFQLTFPSGAVGHGHTSYAMEENSLRIDAAKGWYELGPAFAYRGLKGKSSVAPIDLKGINQQQRQMDDFAYCVLNNKPTRVPGEMGLRDVKILTAIYEAARTGKSVPIRL